jgi:hypothetical protein
MVEIDLQYFQAKWRRLSQEDRLELLFWFNADSLACRQNSD